MTAPDRTARYCARVDAHIAGWTPEVALIFLRKEMATWERRYSRFSTAVVNDTYFGSATAWDFASTIATLGLKIALLEQALQVAA